MGWFVRTTRFGSVHVVYGQEKKASCGIASCIMINFTMKKGRIAGASSKLLQPGIGPFVAPALTAAELRSAVAIEEEVYKIYSSVSGARYDGTDPTNANDLAGLLNRLDIGRWQSRFVGRDRVADALLHPVTGADAHPMLLHVAWSNRGGHFVVCDQVHDFFGTTYACMCDPWNADIVVTRFDRGKFIYYSGEDPVGSWSLGGIKHSYTRRNFGRFSGWVVQRV